MYIDIIIVLENGFQGFENYSEFDKYQTTVKKYINKNENMIATYTYLNNEDFILNNELLNDCQDEIFIFFENLDFKTIVKKIEIKNNENIQHKISFVVSKNTLFIKVKNNSEKNGKTIR